jgi:hypothetical protein
LIFNKHLPVVLQRFFNIFLLTQKAKKKKPAFNKPIGVMLAAGW